MPDPSASSSGAPLLVGLLALVTVVVAAVVWVPIASCPTCEGDGLVTSPPRLTLEETVQPDGQVVRRQVRQPMPAPCPDCDLGGKVSVLRKWMLRR